MKITTKGYFSSPTIHCSPIFSLHASSPPFYSLTITIITFPLLLFPLLRSPFLQPYFPFPLLSSSLVFSLLFSTLPFPNFFLPFFLSLLLFSSFQVHCFCQTFRKLNHIFTLPLLSVMLMGCYCLIMTTFCIT